MEGLLIGVHSLNRVDLLVADIAVGRADEAHLVLRSLRKINSQLPGLSAKESNQLINRSGGQYQGKDRAHVGQAEGAEDARESSPPNKINETKKKPKKKRGLVLEKSQAGDIILVPVTCL